MDKKSLILTGISIVILICVVIMFSFLIGPVLLIAFVLGLIAFGFYLGWITAKSMYNKFMTFIGLSRFTIKNKSNSGINLDAVRRKLIETKLIEILHNKLGASCGMKVKSSEENTNGCDEG